MAFVCFSSSLSLSFSSQVFRWSSAWRSRYTFVNVVSHCTLQSTQVTRLSRLLTFWPVYLLGSTCSFFFFLSFSFFTSLLSLSLEHAMRILFSGKFNSISHHLRESRHWYTHICRDEWLIRTATCLRGLRCQCSRRRLICRKTCSLDQCELDKCNRCPTSHKREEVESCVRKCLQDDAHTIAYSALFTFLRPVQLFKSKVNWQASASNRLQ